jgi:hypothetical protein
VVIIFQLVLALTIGWRAATLRAALLKAAAASVVLAFIPILTSYVFTGDYPSWQIRHLLDVIERWGAVDDRGMPIIDLLDIPLAGEIAYVFAAAALLGAVLASIAHGLKKLAN